VKARRGWLWEFSKRIVVVTATAFFVVLILVIVHAFVFPESAATDRILDNMTDVFKAVVVTYGVKAGFENVWKIAKDRRDGDLFSADDSADSADL
jgi:hypothetical protein